MNNASPARPTAETESVRGLIIGPSGIGKGYGLGAILTEYHGASIFVSGDFCRHHHANAANGGILVSDDLIFEAGKNHFEEQESPKRFFFDCPRTVGQAEQIIAWYKSMGTDQIVVLHMHAEHNVCVQRIQDRAERQGRHDDAHMPTIQRRLSVYYGQNGILKTVIPFLKRHHHVIDIDANHDLEKVRKEVRTIHAPKLFPASAGLHLEATAVA